MRKINKFILAIFCIIVLVLGVIINLLSVGWLEFDVVFKVIRDGFNNEIASKVILVTTEILMLFAVIAIFIDDSDKKNKNKGKNKKADEKDSDANSGDFSLGGNESEFTEAKANWRIPLHEWLVNETKGFNGLSDTIPLGNPDDMNFEGKISLAARTLSQCLEARTLQLQERERLSAETFGCTRICCVQPLLCSCSFL